MGEDNSDTDRKPQITDSRYFNLFSGIREMRPIVSNGIIARKARTARIEKISASFPVRGAIIPPNPKARPIIRLETIDLPLGANSCAMATPSGRVAIAKNPAKKTLK